MGFQHVSFHFLGISFHAKIETWRGGQVRTKKHAVIQTTSIMITEPNTHTYTQLSCLNWNLEGGAGQNKKTCSNSNNKYHDYWTKHTHIHTVVMLKLKPGGGGQVRTKKHAVIQTTSIMITEPNTHTWNLEGRGQVRTKKHAVIQTTSIMITEPNTHTYTQLSCLNWNLEGGAGQNKKTCCNSNNKYHDYWTKHTHIHTVVMLKLKPGGGAGQNKKTCCNSNNKYHDYWTKHTHIHTVVMLKLKPGGGGRSEQKNML